MCGRCCVHGSVSGSVVNVIIARYLLVYKHTSPPPGAGRTGWSAAFRREGSFNRPLWTGGTGRVWLLETIAWVWDHLDWSVLVILEAFDISFQTLGQLSPPPSPHRHPPSSTSHPFASAYPFHGLVLYFRIFSHFLSSRPSYLFFVDG